MLMPILKHVRYNIIVKKKITNYRSILSVSLGVVGYGYAVHFDRFIGNRCAGLSHLCAHLS